MKRPDLEHYRRRIKVRAFLFFSGWFLVLYSLILLPGFVAQTLAWTKPEKGLPTYYFILYDFLGLIVGYADTTTFAEDPLKYRLRLTENILSDIAHLYLYLSLFIMLVPPSARLGNMPIGKMIRFTAFLLLLVWGIPNPQFNSSAWIGTYKT